MMTRINTNIPSLKAINDLNNTNKDLAVSLERLSTGYKINRASDGPASLVISERLKSQVASLRQAVETSTRSIALVNTAEAALAEMSALLISIQDLVIESANDGALSEEEILANQFQIDNALEALNRAANVTNFAGVKLLDGNFEYQTSGLDRSTIPDFNINGAQITNGVSNISVSIRVTSNAERGELLITSAAIGAGNNSGLSLLVTGNKGTELIVLAPNASALEVTSAIEALSDATGVVAETSGIDLVFRSEFYGSDQFVQIHDVTAGNVGSEIVFTRDEGVDLTATINGSKAAARGLTINTNTFQLDATFDLSANFFTTNDTGAGVSALSTFTITGGGATFQLGDDSDIRDQDFIGIQRITTDKLGRASVGFLSSIITGGDNQMLDNPEQAHKIVEASIDDISNMRARLGAFVSHKLETNINSLNISILSLEESLSLIIDADFAAETAMFTRNQVLAQAGTSVLAQANASQQAVLQLLQ